MAEHEKKKRGPRRVSEHDMGSGGSCKALKELRINRRMKQSDLAALLGVSKYTVSGWERGIRFPSWEHMGALAGLLDISISELVGILGIKENAVEMNETESDRVPRCRDRHLTGEGQTSVVSEILRLFDMLDEQGKKAVQAAFEMSGKGGGGRNL